jgi:EAL domain-containing protein (putative c-di-GMP-specific phosphodiesterase class I)/GGDEF domain-containing protein
MEVLAAPVSLHTRPLWRVFLALMLCTALLSALSRELSPLGQQQISLVWPAAGIMLAAWLRFGLGGALACAAGVGVWAIWAFPGAPYIWLVAMTVELAAAGLGAWLTRLLVRSLMQHTGRSTLMRSEWLYCFYSASMAIAALSAGLLSASFNEYTGLFSGYAWYEVAGGYWLVQCLGYILFTPLALAFFNACGYADPALPFSTRTLTWRSAIDWPTIGLATLFTAVLLLMVDWGLLGQTRVLLIWAFVLMAWSAVRTPALPTYLSLAVITMCILPVRTLTELDETDGSAHKLYEVFEGVLMAIVGVFSTQVIQAVLHQNKAQQAQLQQQLRTDAQSGLLNEYGLLEELANTGRTQPAAVVLFHYPALPQLASSLGDDRTQRVQATLAERIQGFGQHATRLDASTYCCIWPYVHENALSQELEQVREQIAGLRIRAGEGTLALQCHIGVLLLDAQQAQADIQAQQYGQSVLAAVWQLQGMLQTPRTAPLVLRISDELNLAARARNERALQIRHALDQGKVELYVQPIEANLNPQAAGTALMCEVLARLRLDDGTLLAPAAFMQILEQYGLIAQLDHLMVEKTFAWFAARPQVLARLARCSINLSGPSISHEGIAAEIRMVAQRLNLPVGKFAFEITESEAIQDSAAAVRSVAQLRAAGFGTAIDDFGTGLATFSYLKRFEVDLIKIDGAFIRLLDDGVRRAEVDREIVRSIVRVAHSLGVKTAAEFVETDAIREHVTALGVHYSQGYAIGKPMPIAQFFE